MKNIEKKWTRIKPWGQKDETTHWVSGIYKITSYRPGEYFAFFIQDWYENWGDHVCAPPNEGEYGKCWKTLKAAQADCIKHAKRHNPSQKTIFRASEIKATLLAQQQENSELEAA